MKKLIFLVCTLILTSCASKEIPNSFSVQLPASSSQLSLPIDEYGQRKTLKSFGEQISDRFTGYHVADDIEYTDTDKDIPVYAIADGEVEVIDDVAGYGGVIRIKHTIDNKTIRAIYGHIALSSSQLQPGDKVQRGQTMAILGKDTSDETDGERKHLHFGVYEGDEIRINGYEDRAAAVSEWINPQDFLSQHGVKIEHPERTFDPAVEIGGNAFKLNFTIPADWEIEYIPSIKALNLFTMAGNGSARERSQVLIRFFDANRFQTLTTVNVLSTTDQKVGKGNYVAKRYDIEKKAGVANFADQPLWRNERHIVTDFRGKEGNTRYYVVAKNPQLSQEQYDKLLASMSILP